MKRGKPGPAVDRREGRAAGPPPRGLAAGPAEAAVEGRKEGEGRGGGVGGGGSGRKISHASTSSAGRPRLRVPPAEAGATAPPGSTPRQTTSSERGPGGGSSNGSKSFGCDSTAGWGDRTGPGKGARGTPGVRGNEAGDFFFFLGSLDKGCLRGIALHPQCRSSPNRLPSDSRKLLKSPTRGMTHSRASAQNKLRHGEEWREQRCWGRAGGAGEGRGGGKGETEGGREKRRGRNNSI